MPDENGRLYLYEALELRREYTRRVKTLDGCLPERRRRRGLFGSGEDSRRLAADFDPGTLRAAKRALDHKQRKLNAAIQRANYEHTIEVDGERVSLNEGLELRKSVHEHLETLSEETARASYVNVIHKEDRDIVEERDRTFQGCLAELYAEFARWRALNRALRAATHEVVVDYRDEPATHG